MSAITVYGHSSDWDAGTGYQSTFAEAHDKEDVTPTTTVTSHQPAVQKGYSDNWHISRVGLVFDTIGVDPITNIVSATIYLRCSGTYDTETGFLVVVDADDVDLPATTSSFKQMLNKTIIALRYYTLIEPGWIVIPLPESALQYIKKGELTHFGLLFSVDYFNQDQTEFDAGQTQGWSFIATDNGSFIPYMVINDDTVEVTTDAATDEAETSATLNGTLDEDGGAACTCGFEYGETELYGYSVEADGTYNSSESFSKGLTGLQPGTVYHCRAWADNGSHRGYGDDVTFTTSLSTSGNIGAGLQIALNQPLFTESPDWRGITADLMTLNIKRGRTHILDKIEAGTATFILYNGDGDYWRYNTASPHYPYFKALTLIRLITEYNSTLYYQFYGFIEAISHGWVQEEGGFAPVTTLQCVDIFKAFSRLKLLPLTGTVGSFTSVGALDSNAASGQKNVVLKTIYDDADMGIDIGRLHEGQSITIGDDNNSETNYISSIDENTYTVTMLNNLANSYDVSAHAYVKKFPSVLSSIRVADVCYELGWPSSLTSIDTGLITVQALIPPTGGTNAMAHLQDCAEAESGLLFIAGNGVLTFQSRDARQVSPYNTSQATFSDSGNQKYILPRLIDDDSLIWNEVRISNSSAGLLEQGYIDGDAQDNQGPRQLVQSSSIIENETDAFDKAYLLTKRLSYSQLRCEGLDILPEADAANLYPKVFGYEISTRITLELNASQNPAGLSKEYHIEGIQHDYLVDSGIWTTSWQLWDINQYQIIMAENDGYLHEEDADWDTCHDAVNADDVYNNDTGIAVGQWNQGGGGSNLYHIWRGFLQFDTSGIDPSDTIISAQIVLMVTRYFVIDKEFRFTLVNGTDLTNPLVASDYGQLEDDQTSFGSVIITTPAINVSYIVIELNTAGIAAINKGGVTNFGLRSLNDISDTAPGDYGDEYITVNGVGSVFVPRLLVNIHEAE